MRTPGEVYADIDRLYHVDLPTTATAWRPALHQEMILWREMVDAVTAATDIPAWAITAVTLLADHLEREAARLRREATR